MRYTGFFTCSLFSLPCSLFPVPCSLKSIKFYLIAMIIAIGLHLKYKPYISLQGAW
ncbi:MAG: hypothetical protein F6J94_04890 [Moorea sp. SIO1F2]|uniref:hypothetical protein n=1 Tax=unclassified Moorena TaxID=2683338 RepID=UPI0013BC21E6|nr:MULTISPECIES: hypothetical protein [unclassified Moorena]NEO23322.1 hypothetical protein [Moorena sp. SIO4A5]NEQ60657.1 hypothetical protein [Moorena sp. SIO4A1]NET81313.1 hypothetical protein [Moorena sp. SIO1F2]